MRPLLRFVNTGFQTDEELYSCACLVRPVDYTQVERKRVVEEKPVEEKGPYHKHPNKSWTRRENGQLSFLREKGLPLLEIASKLERTASSVSARIRRLYLPKAKDED